MKYHKTNGALIREHAYASLAFLEYVHHNFGMYQFLCPSFWANTLFAKNDYFAHLKFLALTAWPSQAL